MTATELKKRAIALAEKTKIDSVTPEEVGQLSNDIVEYIENVEINGSSLGIRKTYTSVSAMEADSTAPKDDKGVLLRRGMLVNIYNQEDPDSADNGKVFSFQNPGWAFRGTVDAGYATKEELTELDTRRAILSSVSSKKDTGKNLFDKESVIKGFYLNSGGRFIELEDYCVSDYIKVTPSERYYISNSRQGGAYSAFYDENGSFLSSIATSELPIITVPSNAHYLRISLNSSTIDSVQVELGDKLTAYKSFTQNYLLENEIEILKGSKVTVSPGKNLFDKNNALSNHFLNSNGELKHTEYPIYVTPFIAVNGNSLTINLSQKDNVYFALYNKDLEVIHVQNGSVLTMNYIEGAEYARFSIQINIDNVMIEYGSETSEYEPYYPIMQLADFAKVIKGNKENIDILRTVTKFDSDKFVYAKQGKNLLNPDGFVVGEWVKSDGSIGAAGFGIGRTNLIKISEGQSLTASTNHTDGFFQCLAALYDKDLNVIEGSVTPNISDRVKSMTITWMEGAEYAIFTFRHAPSDVTEDMIEVGSEVTDYESYYWNEGLQKQVERNSKMSEGIDKALSLKANLEPYINLFNKDAEGIQRGKYLTGVGSFSSNELFFVSDYIPVIVGKSYVGKGIGGEQGGAYGWAFYDINKHFVASSASRDNPVVAPEGAAYLLCCGLISKMDEGMVEQNTVSSQNYYPYKLTVRKEELPADIFPTEGSLKIVLPKKLHFLKDKELVIYFENILLKENSRKVQTLLTQSKIGQTWGNLFAGTPTTAEKGTISVAIVDENMRQMNSSIEYEVYDKATKNGQTINILCTGDSFTDIGQWVNEIYLQLTNNGMTVNQIGTMGKDLYRHEALSGGTMAGFLLKNAGPSVIVNVKGISEKPVTGYPGTSYIDRNGVEWKVRGFKLDGSGNGKLKLGIFKGTTQDEYEESRNFPLSGTLTRGENGLQTGDTSIDYTEAEIVYFNPFWNPSTKKLDFQYYINYWVFNPIDLFIIQFTWNDISTWANDSSTSRNVERVKTIIDQLHLDYPSAKAIFSVEPMGSLYPSNLDIDGKLYGVLKFMSALLEKFEDNEDYNTWFRISPSYMGVDRYNGYGTQEKILCSRYGEETVAGDTVHCNEKGMRQISDVIVPIIYSI